MKILSIIGFFAIIMALYAVSPAIASTIVPAGDYSYSALTDLAHQGLIDGFPLNADLFGGRTFTRYEIATLIARVAGKLESDPKALQAASPQTCDEVHKLLQNYRVELAIIGTDVNNPKLDMKAAADTSPKPATGAIEEANKNTYGNTRLGRYSITGYIQARAVAADSGSTKLYPLGKVSQLAGVYNGNYGEGGAADEFEVRRARIYFIGRPTANSYYRAQLDFAGATTSSTTPVKVKEAADYYTPGDGSSKFPTLALGQFATPFGYVLASVMSSTLTPERPLAFSESTSGFGLFNGQDYDKGLKVLYGPGKIQFTYALINGAGTNDENIYNHFDSVAHVAYTTPDKVINIGASYYNGEAYENPVPTGVEPKKELWGLDTQIKSRGGAFIDGEFVAGTFELRSYNVGGVTTPATLDTDAYVKGNQVEGYYVWSGYTFNQFSTRPMTLAADYDVFQRSKSTSGGADQSSSSYDDVNWGLGALYNLDAATRLRLWWDQPVAIAHEPKTVEPTKVGLVTGEVQLSF